jgi:DNA-binding response OmpR family regulator
MHSISVSVGSRQLCLAPSTYSITSLARNREESGIVNPSTLAVTPFGDSPPHEHCTLLAQATQITESGYYSRLPSNSGCRRHYRFVIWFAGTSVRQALTYSAACAWYCAQRTRIEGKKAMDHRPHIVVVEDEATQRRLLVDYLTRQHYRVSGLDGGTALRRLVERELPALVMLDVGLPGEDGFALARWLREKSARIGIIMVTAASDTVDRVVGLETGADDYIAKPFEPRELLARVKSVLRRATGAVVATGPRVPMGRRILDLEKRVLVDPADSSEETLTASEFDLLKVFAENPNRPLQRDWLLEVTTHRDMGAFDRAIDLRITRLRRKIELDPAHPDAIRTVRGVGYMFVPSTA